MRSSIGKAKTKNEKARNVNGAGPDGIDDVFGFLFVPFACFVV
jgi:hypothetical protein